MKKVLLSLGVCLSLGTSVASAGDSYVRGSLGWGLGVSYGYNLDTVIHPDGKLSIEVDGSFAPFGNTSYFGFGGGVRYTHQLNEQFYLSGKFGAGFIHSSWSSHYYDGYNRINKDYSDNYFGAGASVALGYKLNQKFAVGLEGGYAGTGVGGLFVRYNF